jgi:hypothetical protein
MLAALLPLLDGLLIAALLRTRVAQRLTIREAQLIAGVLLGGWLVAGTELLSLGHLIAFGPVLCWWLAPLPALIAGFFVTPARHRLLPSWPRLTAFDYCLLTVILAVLGWSLCQAWFSPPNNVDSQEYHLQRQVYWIQQGSVEHFATSNLRQVAMPPLSEYAGMTLMVLTGGDRYHNLIQWAAFALALGAVSLIARRFNRSPTSQLLAAVWTVTIPLAFMQASTTKNDVIVLLLAGLLAYWSLLLDSTARLRWPLVMLMGLAFGELILTKGTGLIFSVPVAGWVAFSLLRRQPRKAATALALIAALALAINAGQFGRNYRAFGSVAPDQPGIHDGPSLANADHSVGALASNMIRSIASHAVTPSQPWNDGVTALVRQLHDKLGRNIDDPNSTWVPLGRFRPYRFWQNDEDKAAAPAHLLLALLLIPLVWWRRRYLPWRTAILLAAMAVTGFVLFSWLLKWQNWHVRLVIALPALIAPVFGWTFGNGRWRWAGAVAVSLLVVTLVPSLNSLQHPMWGARTIFSADPLALRCYYRPTWPADYREIASRIVTARAQVVGFFTGPGSPDYPMQRLLLDTSPLRPKFTAFNGKFQVPGKAEPDPDVLLVARSNAQRLQHESTGTWYVLQQRVGRYGFFVKEMERH